MAFEAIRTLWDVDVIMRDGVRLSADVYLPAAPGTYPAIVQRTPYDNTLPLWVGIAASFAERGYVFVLQDVRGRGDSDGRFVPWVHEAEDGYDTVEWMAAQPWCNGHVGMMGSSYGGYVVWAAASLKPPHLRAAASTSTAGRWWHESPYRNGAFGPTTLRWHFLTGGRSLQGGLGINLPVDWARVMQHRPFREADQFVGRTNTAWGDWIDHNTLDDYWQRIMVENFGEIAVPVLHVTGWYDGAQTSSIYNFQQMAAHSPQGANQWAIFGPWDHGATRRNNTELGGIKFTEAAVLDMDAIHLRFFDHFLKGEDNGQQDEARVKLFTLGSNTWRECPTFPPADSIATPYYLHHQEGVRSLNTDLPGDEPADTYTYDPEDPTPAVPDLAAFFQGPYSLNQADYLEKRADVLVFTTDPVTEALEITGTPRIALYAATDAVDTDFAAVLSDVHPDGASYYLCEGIMRLAFRDSLTHPTPAEPGTVYHLMFDLTSISVLLLPGHCLRLTIASCRFPYTDRNPNTGAPVGHDAITRPAQQTIYHNSAYPSHIILPVRRA
ncbi:MAG: CocE/NonD family hydrolase [Anaerolineae bacterium]